MASAIPGDEIWNDLEPALARVHSRPPVVLAQAEFGPDAGGPPLSRIVAYPEDQPSPHWHIVTCGLSASRFIQGYPDLRALELSFRLARPADEATPPAWVPGFLQALGRNAFADDRPLAAGESVDLEPLWQDHDTAVTAGFYVADPSSDGPISLVQLVALTAHERGRVKSSDAPDRLVFELAPLGISDLGRLKRPPPATPRATVRAPAPPALPPAPALATLTVQKIDGRMRLSVAPVEAGALAEALLLTIRAGRLQYGCNGWTINLNVEDIARSATWATTLALYFTIELAKEMAAALNDPTRHGQPLRWTPLPDCELFVAGDAPRVEKPGLGARLKGFFGAR